MAQEETSSKPGYATVPPRDWERPSRITEESTQASLFPGKQRLISFIFIYGIYTIFGLERVGAALFHASSERIPIFESVRVKADISRSAWSVTAQRFAQECIRACIQHHDECGSGDALLPARVIEVRNVGDERLRLFETQGSTAGQYTALSYCWGGDQPLKTTSENIKDMTSGLLLLSELPQTIADAVHVTRALGIPYLWVDALCIIQNSDEDWERQSEQMSTIYEKAYLVIAASSSSSAMQGFLNNQRPKQPHYFNTPQDYGTQATIAVRLDPASGFHSRHRGKAKTDPLSERAWAFQEQYMATRSLIFSADELQWVCKTTAVCECGIPDRLALNHPMLLTYCDRAHQGAVSSTEPALPVRDLWRNVVQDYSCRKITHPDDKLPAISGIASRFGAKNGSRYIAGLWEEDIIQNLSWTRVPRKSELASVPAAYRAPSFSWVSIDEQVLYLVIGPVDLISCSSILDIGTVVPGRNPFGKVTDGWITIQAPIVRGLLELDQDLPARFRSDDREMSVSLDMDSAVCEFRYTTEDDKRERSIRRCKSLQPHENYEVKRSGDGDEPHNHAEPDRTNKTIQSNFSQASVWLVHFSRVTGDPAETQKSTDFYLVLGKSPRDPRKYERIGLGRGFDPREPLAEHHSRFTTKTITIL